MSKLDREIRAVFDEAAAFAEPLIVLVAKWLEEGEDDIQGKTIDYIEEHKPKTYDDYTADLKLIFKQNGWIEP